MGPELTWEHSCKQLDRGHIKTAATFHENTPIQLGYDYRIITKLIIDCNFLLLSKRGPFIPGINLYMGLITIYCRDSLTQVFSICILLSNQFCIFAGLTQSNHKMLQATSKHSNRLNTHFMQATTLCIFLEWYLREFCNI